MQYRDLQGGSGRASGTLFLPYLPLNRIDRPDAGLYTSRGGRIIRPPLFHFHLETARANCMQGEFVEYWAEGRALDQGAAIAYALVRSDV